MLDDQKRVTPGGIALLLLVIVACGLVVWRARQHASPVGSNTLARIHEGGVVRIGYANEAPYGYLNTVTGEVTGEAPEIARVILSEMGVRRIEPVVAEFGALIPGLKAGRFDLIAAGMYITPPRCRQIAFSNPTYKIGEAFAVRRGNPLDLHSYEDVARHPTARLGFVGGTVEQGYARAVGIPDERVLLFPDNISALTALRTGRVDACAATSLTIHDLLRKADTGELEMAQPFQDPVIDGQTVYGYGAFGFRRDDVRFREEFNRRLGAWIGSRRHLQLTRPFGISPQTLPGDVTAEELCRTP